MAKECTLIVAWALEFALLLAQVHALMRLEETAGTLEGP